MCYLEGNFEKNKPVDIGNYPDAVFKPFEVQQIIASNIPGYTLNHPIDLINNGEENPQSQFLLNRYEADIIIKYFSNNTEVVFGYYEDRARKFNYPIDEDWRIDYNNLPPNEHRIFYKPEFIHYIIECRLGNYPEIPESHIALGNAFPGRDMSNLRARISSRVEQYGDPENGDYYTLNTSPNNNDPEHGLIVVSKELLGYILSEIQSETETIKS